MKFDHNSKPDRPPIFSDGMKRELMRLYHTMTLEELGEYFGVKPNQVKNQATRQYLTRRGKK